MTIMARFSIITHQDKTCLFACKSGDIAIWDQGLLSCKMEKTG